MPIGGKKRPDASKIQLSSNSYSNGVPISQYQNIRPSVNWERYQDSLDNMEYVTESESESESEDENSNTNLLLQNQILLNLLLKAMKENK